ncbi:hypothetical protein DFH29DRAFT_1000454 [Suillus ampliporus]|nr:hypothetical protein DFH29DRAFT_1000454 [Suillus ampliporus]
MTAEHIFSRPPMDFLSNWILTPTPDKLVANQGVIGDDLYCAFVNPPSSPFRANDMVEFLKLFFSVTLIVLKMSPSKTLTSPNHPAQPTGAGQWTSGDKSSSSGHNCRDFTQGQYSTGSVFSSNPQALAIPQPHSVYSYPTTTNMLASVSSYGSWHNTPTIHSSRYNNPVFRDASVEHFCSPAITGSDYSSPSTFAMQNLNGHSCTVHHSLTIYRG